MSNSNVIAGNLCPFPLPPSIPRLSITCACMPHPLTYILSLPHVAPGPPQNLEVVTVFHNSLVLRWDPPSRPNGIITKYTVSIE